jgi:CheY-like chemotaxis protein
MAAQPHESITAHLTEAEKECARARELIHQLLTFSQGTAPTRHTISLAELLGEVTHFVFQRSNVRGDLTISDDLWPVDLDRGQMHEVFVNVLLNAVEAMPAGGIVQVRAENITMDSPYPLPLQPGRYIKITIRDQGCGIPAEHLPKIFHPYFTTKEGNSGLGLPTAYAIVGKHDGWMTIDSTVQVGTTVSIYLPAARLRPRAEQTAARHSQARRSKILVLADDAETPHLVGKMLASLDYEVTHAGNGAEAVAAYYSAQVADQPFTAVILECPLSGEIDGREILAQLHAIDPQVKALLSRRDARAQIMDDFRQYGCCGVLTKPYTVAELYDALQRVVHG